MAKVRFTFPSSFSDGVELDAGRSAGQLFCAKKTGENETLRQVSPIEELCVIEPIASSARRVGKRSVNGQGPLIRRRCCHGALLSLLQVRQMNQGQALECLGIRSFRELDCGVVAR